MSESSFSLSLLVHKITQSKHFFEVIIPDLSPSSENDEFVAKTFLEQTICHCQYCKQTSWSCLLCSDHKTTTHILYLGDNLASKLFRPVLFLLLWLDLWKSRAKLFWTGCLSGYFGHYVLLHLKTLISLFRCLGLISWDTQFINSCVFEIVNAPSIHGSVCQPDQTRLFTQKWH